LGLATRLKAEGLIRGFGISCDDIETAQAAVQFREVDVVQFELDDSAETLAILETAERSGKPALVRGVARRVTELGGGPGALSQALGEAWSRPAVGGIIVGTTSVAHLRENVGAFQQALGHGDRKDGA
jgi:aryl-alcohol dehydrogenase-like predicted oxidoreductase